MHAHILTEYCTQRFKNKTFRKNLNFQTKLNHSGHQTQTPCSSDWHQKLQ